MSIEETPAELVHRISDDMAANEEEPLLTMDGYDDCILGIVRRFNDLFVLYDQRKVLQRLEEDGLSPEEALEFFEFNQVGAWVGERTPAFLVTFDSPEIPAEESPDG